MNRQERRALARVAVKRGEVNGQQVRIARKVFAGAVRASEEKQQERELEERVGDAGLVVAKQRIWTPGRGEP